MKFESNVSEIIQRAHDVKSFRFPRPEGLNYKAGQFLMVTVKSDGKELMKHFSISSSPTENYIEFTKKLTGHEFSNALDAMKVGDWARIDAPYGTFTFEGEYDKICLLSGGIGITPLRSICRYCTDKKLNSSIVLLYGCRNEEAIVFRQELVGMEQENKNLKLILMVDETDPDWKGYVGRIDAQLLRKEVPDYSERRFYVCGPPAMVQVMSNILKELNIPNNQLKVDYFTGFT